MRTSQLRLLSLTPAEGLRVTDLAERVGMTKQALGEFADALERQGLLESVRDPTDRRVRILRPTASGRAVVARAEEAIAVVETRGRERIGGDRWDDLVAALRAVSRPDAPGPADPRQPPQAPQPPQPPQAPPDPPSA